jgi:hypothetical protein
MSKFEQRAMIRFFILKGFRPQQIQTELSDVYYEKAFQLSRVEKWYFRFGDRTRGLEDERRSEQARNIDFTARLPSCFARSRSYPARRYVDD